MTGGKSGKESVSEETSRQKSQDRLLRVRNLSYRHADGVKVFDGLDLEVRPGEIVAIMGGSGTGKTTLAELVFRLRTGNVFKGEITLDTDRSALLLQDTALFEHLTVGENLALVLKRRHKKVTRKVLAELLDRVGIEESFLDRRPESLSGGQARRVALARALSADPELIYCDEPSAGLDLDAVRQVGRLLRKVVSGSKRGAVVVTHDPILAAVVADRVLLLDRGVLDPVMDWSEKGPAQDEEELQRRVRQLEEVLLGAHTAMPESDEASVDQKVGAVVDRRLRRGDHVPRMVRAAPPRSTWSAGASAPPGRPRSAGISPSPPPTRPRSAPAPHRSFPRPRSAPAGYRWPRRPTAPRRRPPARSPAHRRQPCRRRSARHG